LRSILEADVMFQRQIKEKIEKEYLRRVRKVEQSKLTHGQCHFIYICWGIIVWTKQELKELDRKSRKLLKMNGGLNLRDCVARLYVPKKHGGRGLIAVEYVINQARLSLEMYVQSSAEELLKAVRKEDTENQETATSFKEGRRAENTQEWNEKPLYRQITREAEYQRNDETWTWWANQNIKARRPELVLVDKSEKHQVMSSHGIERWYFVSNNNFKSVHNDMA